jgi:hypothetical protein
LTWVERNRAHLENLRAYVAGFDGRAPAPFAWFQGGPLAKIPLTPESDRGTAVLLCFCALYQGITERKLMGLLASLWEAYGPDFLRLNKLPFEDLQARIDGHPGLADWAIRKQAPGILRSACDFFYKHGRPTAWVESVGDGEACVDILCEEIFLMGKTSLFKSKARYFLWLLTQLPGARPGAFWSERTLLPIAPGHMRFLREFGPLHGRRRVPWSGPEEKLAYVNRFMRLLAPQAPWSAYAPLEAYLKPAGSTAPGTPPRWECREALGGCLNCPLAPLCPGREEF